MTIDTNTILQMVSLILAAAAMWRKLGTFETSVEARLERVSDGIDELKTVRDHHAADIVALRLESSVLRGDLTRISERCNERCAGGMCHRAGAGAADQSGAFKMPTE